FGEVVSGLDIATNMDAETAATEMAQFANITKLSHDEVNNYASAIVGLGNNFATTEADISAMAMRLAASGTQVGMTQADILGIATALASMGVEAEAGGTAISTIMAQIDKDVALSGAVMSGTSDLTQAEAEKVSAALETWASTAGLTAQEFADAWTSNPVDALTTLLGNMESATAEGGNMSVMLQELGIDAIRQADVMKRLAGNADFVTEAVAKSNEEWEKNTALTREVENKNNSLESKFQMLQNRVAAVGVDIGGPLADALLEAVEAAEPLFDAIEKGAEAFTNMDKESQQLIVSIAAAGVALGPLLTLLGGLIRNGGAIGTAMKVATTGVSKFHVAMGNMSAAATVGKGSLTGVTASIGGAASKSVVAATAVSSIGKAFSALSSAGGLAALSLAAVVAGFVFDQWQQYQKHLENVEGATTGLRTATDSFGGAYEEAKGAIAGASGALEDYQSDLEGALQKQKDLADKISETWEKLGTDSGMLDGYMETIDELAGKTGLSKDEQDKLAIAVANVNEICGTNYSVIDSQNGVLSANKDAIYATVDAWKANAKAQAAQEEMVELAREQRTWEKERQAAIEAVTAAQEQYNNAMSNANTPRVVIDEYARALENAKTKANEADLALLANKASMQDLEKEYLSSQEALSRTTAS
ncbi:MAG: phage tail tape measure protein, partial [Raoultibacter sp.]